MSQKIEIGVDAKLNTQAVEEGAKRIDKTLQDVSKRTIDPVPDSTAKKLDAVDQVTKRLDKTLKDVGKRAVDPVPDDAVKKIEALFQTYLKLDREMARRLNVTGQKGRSLSEIDWEPVYQNQKTRSAKLRQLQSFLRNGGAEYEPHGGQPPRRGGFAAGAAQVAGGAAQAGLRAAGPVGGVAANSLGTGMSAGFGAGLMGLVGGLAALGVGKLVGAVAENVGKAEDNNIAYDRLKRTLGDVNVSFAALKTAVVQSGDTLKLTYGDTAQLATSFTKAGNLRGQDYKSLPEELGYGVGLSRAYGLDPGQGVGVLGSMRGVGVTKDTQETRRIALLIGETIAKSDAFAKADEVMEAIANFATTQTRQSLSAANVNGYAGMFSAMNRSGIAGLDPSGSAAILARMNSALSAGGAKGEASQFFTSMVGNRMGLGPLQMQVLREGGMFATKDQMFGGGSAYARYMGKAGPGGDQDFLSATRQLIEERYSGDSDDQKLLRANAFANHAGLNMNQAMAMLSIKPDDMGMLEKVLGKDGLKGASASGINNAAMALFGSADDRRGVANSLRARGDLKVEDRKLLDSAMSSDDEQGQKEVLAKLSAQYEQERTTGKDIADSRALLDNIKTKMADAVVPTLLDMKNAMLYMAGVKDGKTPAQIVAEVRKAEARDEYDRTLQGIAAKKKQLGADIVSGKVSRADALGRLDAIKGQEVAAEIGWSFVMNPIVAADDLARLGKGPTLKPGSGMSPTGAPNLAENSSPAGGNGAPLGKAARGKVSDAMKFFMDKGWTKEQAAGIVANLHHESGLKTDVVGDGGRAYGIAQWHPDRQANFAKWAGKDIRKSSLDEQMGFVHYELTEGKEKAAGRRLSAATTAGQAGAVISRYYERPLRADAEANSRAAIANRIHQTPIPTVKSTQAPSAPQTTGGSLKVADGRQEIVLKDQKGNEIARTNVPTRVGPANPDTYTRSGATGTW